MKRAAHDRPSAVRLWCAAVVMPLLTIAAATPNATALSPGLAFSADQLPTWQTDDVVWALAQTQGKVIAGGDFTTLRPPEGQPDTPVATSALAILDAETGVPDPCQLQVGISVPGGRPTVRALTAAPDGTVYVGGNFSSIGGVDVGRLAAVDLVTCTVKPLFTPGIDSTVRAVALHGTTLYVGGDFGVIDGLTRQHFAAVDATSGALLPWQADADLPGRAIGVSPDGTKVALGGDFFSINGQASHSIAVVDGLAGTVLRAYPDFVDALSATKSIWSSADRFYVGNEGGGGGVFDGRFAVSWDTLDEVWRDTCLGATQAVLEHQGTLYSASHAHDCSSARGYQEGRRNFFNAQDAATSTLIGWDPRANDGTGEGLGPRALTVATGQVTGAAFLWSGGEFTRINGLPQQGLTRFGPDDVGAPPTPEPALEATGSGVQVMWRTVVDPDDSRLTYAVYRNGAPTPLWTGTARSVWWKRPQVTFLDRSAKPGAVYRYRVTASDGTSTSPLSGMVSVRARARGPSYASTIRADRPTLYWNSRRSGPSQVWLHDLGARGSSTRRINGLVAGGAASHPASPVAGDTSGSLKFDGVDDYLWEDEYVPGPTRYTLETWIRTRTLKGGSIIGYGNGRPQTNSNKRQASTAGAYDRVVYLTNQGRIYFGVDTGQRLVTINSPAAVNDGRWHHLVATQGPGGMALYIDGVRVASKSVTANGSYYGVWHVGGDTLAGYPGQHSKLSFTGLIDETAVYPVVLGRNRVLAHFRTARTLR